MWLAQIIVTLTCYYQVLGHFKMIKATFLSEQHQKHTNLAYMKKNSAVELENELKDNFDNNVRDLSN